MLKSFVTIATLANLSACCLMVQRLVTPATPVLTPSVAAEVIINE